VEPQVPFRGAHDPLQLPAHERLTGGAQLAPQPCQPLAHRCQQPGRVLAVDPDVLEGPGAHDREVAGEAVELPREGGQLAGEEPLGGRILDQHPLLGQPAQRLAYRLRIRAPVGQRLLEVLARQTVGVLGRLERQGQPDLQGVDRSGAEHLARPAGIQPQYRHT
jgi:hypothetical protein